MTGPASDRYERMLQLADTFHASGEEMRGWARIAEEILGDDDVTASAELSKATYTDAETQIRDAATGKHGLTARVTDLDADALVVRATVLTYQWIDELQDAAYRTLGKVAGRAIGYLAPEIELGGAILSAGVIETDALDRDGVAAYLNELAESNPELMDHLTTGGGGLLDGLQMRALLTAGVLGGENGAAAARGGLAATGAGEFTPGLAGALRDIAGGYDDEVAAESPTGPTAAEAGRAPGNIEALMSALADVADPVQVQRVAPGRFIAYLPGERPGTGGLRLSGADTGAYADQVLAALTTAVRDDADPRVMLVGAAQGGVVAAQLAARLAEGDQPFAVDQVITAGAPSAQVPTIPESTRVLSLEDRSDPVALLGSLINARVSNRLTVVFDGAASTETGRRVYVEGGRAADAATHPDLRAAIAQLTDQGYLAPVG